ncbi:MAG TPA: hypothetical protein DCY13_02780 [Verrucomicrobiales bacterium]|nr:hypothetical protein [Verrucomicrobiales bacterium]
MKKLIISAIAAAVLALPGAAFADHHAKEGKEVTLKGEGKCGKCALKEADKCTNVIEVKDGEKKIVYWLEQNDVSKAFHKNVCSDTVKVTAVGKVSEKDGKKILVASKIEKQKE